MLSYLKQLKWDLSSKYGRLLYYSSFIREIPGIFGEKIRENVYKKYFMECGENITIYQGVRFRGIHKLQIGNNVHIGVDNFIQASGGVSIGNNVLLGPGVKIWSVNHSSNLLDVPIFDQGYEYSSVEIADDVWLGANTFVMPGVKIPRGCIASAGCVIGKKNYPEFSLLAGNPARVIGNRNKTT
jgi:acetyltransferase-like isoleucine patch superfamily enzyme